MKRILSSLTFLTCIFLVASCAQTFAQSEGTMNVHVSKAVAIPSKVLLPGDYVFRPVDSVAWPSDVAITSADGKTFYGIVPVQTTYRESASGSEITTTAPDKTGLARIDSWYFPGSSAGFRFAYSPSEIRKLDMVAQQLLKSDQPQGGLQ